MKSILLKDYRLLTDEEHKDLLQIRNADEIREVSLDAKIISFDEHLSWIKKLQDDRQKEYFAVMYNDKIIGGVNIFNIDAKVKWGVFFESLAPLMIKSIIPIYFMDFIFSTFTCSDIYAEIKKENLNAISYNKSLGFKLLPRKDIVTMHLTHENYLKAKNGVILKRVIKKMTLYKFKIERYDER
ncbi:MAG: GNAT family N-acetyltransferase [Campylobacterales bacterium]|nr:GNAT family N-acetyltransferase [Campylobacterales bacterium]